jgi:hypothetical protein
MSALAATAHSPEVATVVGQALDIIQSFSEERLFDDIDGTRVKLGYRLADLMTTSSLLPHDLPAFAAGVSDTLQRSGIEAIPYLGEILLLKTTGELTGSLLDSQRQGLRMRARHIPSSATYQSPVAYSLDKLETVSFPARKPLLFRADVPIFREGHIGEVYAARGIGKTWLLQTLALVAATGGEAMGISAPEAGRVLYIDGEMSSEEVRDRFAHLCQILGVKPSSNLVVIGADWQDDPLPPLDTEDGQSAVEPFVAEADLIVLDNRSCLFDPEGEKDPSAWQAAQEWLLGLRRRGKAILLGHHSNRNGGARGIGKPEDVMNLLLKLTRPGDYTQDQGARFLVEFDKARGIHGSAAAPFVAALTQEGWVVEGDRRFEGSAESRIREQAEAIRMGVTQILYASGNAGTSRNSLEAGLRNAKLYVGKTATFSDALNALVGESLRMEVGQNRSHLYKLTQAAFDGAPAFLGLGR